jgi:hypothetical protein
MVGWLVVGSGRRGRGVDVGAATPTSAAGGRHRRWAGRAARRPGAGPRCRSTRSARMVAGMFGHGRDDQAGVGEHGQRDRAWRPAVVEGQLPGGAVSLAARTRWSQANAEKQAKQAPRPLTCGFGARGRIRADDLPITSRTRWLQTDLACSRWMPRRSRRLQTDTGRIVWMIKWMIKAHHPTRDRMARRAWGHALFIRRSLGPSWPVCCP